MKNKLFVLLLAVLSVITIGCSSDEKTVSVIGITLNKENITLTEGQSEVLSYNIAPSDADDKSVSWKSSNSSVASVNEGKVTAIKQGQATISVSTNDGNKIAKCNVTVNSKIIPVTNIEVTPKNLEIKVGEKGEISASISPENATNKSIVWKSSDENVAVVSNGEVSGIAEGDVVIYASVDGVCDSSIVTVSKIGVDKVEINQDAVKINVGDSLKLTVTVSPENATYPDITWVSSNTEIATINESGVIVGKKEGTTNVIAIADNISSQECIVEVSSVPVQSITLNRSNVSLLVDETIRLSATIYPQNATDKTIDWSSTNNDVAYVRDGKVVAMNVGTAIIKAQTSDGKVNAVCNVTVNQRPKLAIEYVSQYNLKTAKVFSDSYSCRESGYFDWQSALYASPSGYHTPSVDELMGVFADCSIMKLTGYDFKSVEDNYVTEDITVHSVSASYQAAYYCNDDGVMYAIKFKGMGEELRSAYRYEYVVDKTENSTENNYYIKVTVRYLGKAFDGKLKDIADESYWNNDNSHDITRIFPACGGYAAGMINGNPSYGRGRYWTSDEFKNATPKTIGDYLSFGSDLKQISLPAQNDKTGKFTVRPFADN